MRYEKAEQILRLCVMMASRLGGVTLDAIMSEFETSRRTAERMRDAAIRLLPGVEEWTDDAGCKHWKATKLPAAFTAIQAEELTELSLAANVLRDQGRDSSAATLEVLGQKLTAIQSRQTQARLESDVELLMESEGLAFRPGPRVRVDHEALETIRTAILASLRLKGRYHSRAQNTVSDVLLEPHGILYGNRPFLIARSAGWTDLRHYRLQSFSELAISEESFERIEGFDIEDYSRELFGTFQELAFDVAWKFRPSAAADAAGYIFHPDQTLETTEDGSLIVRFRAGGSLEMAWHLATWGDAVEVLEPGDFWNRVRMSRNNLVEVGNANAVH